MVGGGGGAGGAVVTGGAGVVAAGTAVTVVAVPVPVPVSAGTDVAGNVPTGVVAGTALGAGTTTTRRVITGTGSLDELAFLALTAIPPTINSPALSEMPVTAIRPPMAACCRLFGLFWLGLFWFGWLCSVIVARIVARVARIVA